MSELTRRSWLASAAAVSVTGVVAALPGCAGAATLAVDPATEPWKVEPKLDSLAPMAPREFRAAWVATVANIDWPSRRGLPTAVQQAEITTILDRAASMRLNAIILQVRTSADALYASELEPWSEYLTGVQGQAPSPYYDPLEFWIDEAHQRGLELHAWFNPFRARQSDAKSPVSAMHLSKARPGWVRTYGAQLWIDPGESAAADHTLAVMMDVLRRYNVDGIHIDDYFYPYPVTQADDSKNDIEFPDQSTWQRYQVAGGSLVRDDWRRNNVDKLVARIYEGIRGIKPWVRFGISPFGIGRPDLSPAGIQGFSQYHKLYADVERWMREGWFDYLVPQLYWPRAQKEQAFGVLLDYWHGQNLHSRHVWPGLFTSRVGDASAGARATWPAGEIVQQIEMVRQRAPGSGHAHFSMVALLQNRQGLSDVLQRGAYASPALVPASPWLSDAAPEPPRAQFERTPQGHWQLSLRPSDGVGQGGRQNGGRGERWAVWARFGPQWTFRVVTQWPLQFPSPEPAPDLPSPIPTPTLNAVVLSAVSRVGIESERVGWLLPVN